VSMSQSVNRCLKLKRCVSFGAGAGAASASEWGVASGWVALLTG